MIQLAKDLKTGKGHIEFDIDEQEYCAIGRVTAQWAYLGHGVYAVTANIAKANGREVPGDARSTSFQRRLSALRLLIEECVPGAEREQMLKLISRIANAEQDRHKITHAMWDWDRANPDRISASSFRPGLEFEKKFDAQKMHELANRIGEISFELEYPEGWDAAFKEQLEAVMDESGNVRYADTSRRLIRELTSNSDQEERESGSAMPQESKPPPFSSS